MAIVPSKNDEKVKRFIFVFFFCEDFLYIFAIDRWSFEIRVLVFFRCILKKYNILLLLLVVFIVVVFVAFFFLVNSPFSLTQFLANNRYTQTLFM